MTDEENIELAVDGEQGEEERLLDQSEIESLLGGGANQQSDQIGIKALLDPSSITYDRLPMLEVVFDRLTRLLSTSLRNFTNENVEVAISATKTQRFGDYLDTLPLPTLINIFGAKEWDTSFLLIISNELIYSIIDILLGGRRCPMQVGGDGRLYTTIERSLIEKFIIVILSDFTKSFTPVCPVTFAFDRMETNPRFASIVRPENALITYKVEVDMDGRGGNIEFALPYSSLEPARENLLQMFMGEKFGKDSMWETHLASEVWNTKISAEAILDQVSVKLGDVLNWQPGTHLQLEASPDSQVFLRCGEQKIVTGKVGNARRKVAVQVDKNHLKEAKSA